MQLTDSQRRRSMLIRLRRLGDPVSWSDIPEPLFRDVIRALAALCFGADADPPDPPDEGLCEPYSYYVMENDHSAFVLIQHPERGALLYVQTPSREGCLAVHTEMVRVTARHGFWVEIEPLASAHPQPAGQF